MDNADGASVAGGQDQGSDRAISGAETLRALADPLRLRILSTLMQRDGGALPVMSVKELAASLGEPQTKLYRHVKHLEGAGLIKSVASRVVSGIVEQRYQASQSDLKLGTTLDQTQKMSAEAEAAAAAVLELYRSQFFAAHRSGLAAFRGPDTTEREPHRETILSMSVTRVPRARAAEIRERLQQVVDAVTEAETEEETEDTVTVNVLVGYFSPTPRTGARS